MSRYLPKCVTVFWDNGRYVAVHWETSRICKHVTDDLKPSNLVIGQGNTRTEAIRDARDYFDFDARLERTKEETK